MALLCHAVALGKKKHRSRSKSGVALCHGVPPFPLFTCAISSFFAPKPHGNACYAGYGRPREQCRSVPRAGVEKKKMDRSRTERAVSLCATGWR